MRWIERHVVESKICHMCKELKLAAAFYKRTNAPDGLQHSCKDCMESRDRGDRKAYRKAYDAAFKKAHPEARRAQTRKGFLKSRQRNKEFVDAAKKEPCKDCGFTFPPCAMDFDHVRGEKSDALSSLVNKAATLERLYQEIRKCELVCSNCHRVRTFNRGYYNGVGR